MHFFGKISRCGFGVREKGTKHLHTVSRDCAGTVKVYKKLLIFVYFFDGLSWGYLRYRRKTATLHSLPPMVQWRCQRRTPQCPLRKWMVFRAFGNCTTGIFRICRRPGAGTAAEGGSSYLRRNSGDRLCGTEGLRGDAAESGVREPRLCSGGAGEVSRGTRPRRDGGRQPQSVQTFGTIRISRLGGRGPPRLRGAGCFFVVGPS